MGSNVERRPLASSQVLSWRESAGCWWIVLFSIIQRARDEPTLCTVRVRNLTGLKKNDSVSVRFGSIQGSQISM